MADSYASRRRGGVGAGAGGGLPTTMLATKVAFASAALAAAVSFARLALPHLVSAAGAFLPRAWSVARFWLAPPYLFVTVHVIIFVIWKLSDHKHFHAAQHKEVWAPAVHPPPPAEEVACYVKPKHVLVASADFGEPEASPEISPLSAGGESCVTTESDEDSSTAASYIVDSRRSKAPVLERTVLERKLSAPATAVSAAAVSFAADDDDDHDNGSDDDLDATWNAIMQKTRPAETAASSPPQKSWPPRPPPRARDPSVGVAELNKRSEDFIKKIHNSFGRQ